MKPCEMTSPVGVQHENAAFMKGEVYYPSLHPQYEGHPLQKRERRLIMITDPDDCSRDMMAELYGMKMSSLCSITVEAPVPLKTTPPMEAEPNTAPASETQSQKKTREPVKFFIPLTEEEKEEAKKADLSFGDSSFDHQMLTGGDIVEAPAPLQATPLKNLRKRPGLLLFSIPPEEEVKQKTKSQKKTREPVIFFIPLTKEEEEEQVKKANIMFGDFLFEYPVLTGGDIVEAPAPLETTFTKEVEPNTADITPEPAPVEIQTSEPHPAASPSVPAERKQYDLEFLLRLQFNSFSMRRPESLPIIPGVVLDKQCELKKQRKIITCISLDNDVKLNKAEKAWKPAVKKSSGDEDDQEMVKTQELFQKVRSILNKLTPQMFQQLMKRFMELTIDTEERLRGVVDLIFEKAISEPNYSLTYANMCHHFVGLKVPTSDNSGATVSFCSLLLNRCQKEFEKDKVDDEISQQKQELDAATEEEVQQLLNKARHRSLGYIKFIGELFKQEMMKEQIMHSCIVKLLNNYNEESLEVLCKLLSTIGKKLDLEVSKPCMDRYFQQMEQIVKERKTSSRIRFMMQDVLDLRKNNWVPRRGDQGPKTIDQIHKDAELEEQIELIKVQQLLQSKENPCQEPSRTNEQTTDKPRLTLNRFSVLQESELSSTSCSSSLDECRDLQDQELDMKAVCKPALSEEEVEKKTTPIIEEYLNINDLKEAVQCVKELNSPSVLFVFVRTAVESVLDRSTVARERMGLLLHRLVLTRVLPPNQYFRGLREILEVADDMAIDIPLIWQYLAEIISPMLRDGGIYMRLLFREVTKPLLPIGKAAVLLVHILNQLNHSEAAALWTKARLNWKDFLPEHEDVNKFVTEQKVEFTLRRRPERSS